MTDPREGWRSGLTNDEIRQQALRGYLANRDWTHGLTRERILADLALTPVLAGVVERGLAPGVYFSAADVLAALPPSAWEAPASPPTAGETPERQGGRPGMPSGLPGVPAQVLAGAGGAAVLGALVLLWERRRRQRRGGPRWRWLQA